MLKKVLVLGSVIASLLIGGQGGYLKAENTYQELLLNQEKEYKVLLDQAKQQEQRQKDESTKIETEYEERIRSIQSNNDALVARLRNQLSILNQRLSSKTQSSSQSNDSSRETELSERLGEVIEFSNRCSKRADELIIQLEALQEWVNKVK